VAVTPVVNSRGRECPPLSWYVNGKCYRLTDAAANWEESQQRCKAYGDTFNLASFHSQEDFFWVTTMLRIRTGIDQIFWLGLNDIEKEGNFKWIDGTNVDYVEWQQMEPNDRIGAEDCVVSHWPKGEMVVRWNDVPCTHSEHRYAGLCAADPYPAPLCEDQAESASRDAFPVEYCAVPVEPPIVRLEFTKEPLVTFLAVIVVLALELVII
jgi:hypothetical protein